MLLLQYRHMHPRILNRLLLSGLSLVSDVEPSVSPPAIDQVYHSTKSVPKMIFLL